MIKKIITETVDIHDSGFNPKGYVIIKDKDGNVLVKKHNMIVKDGKDFIFGAFFNAAFNQNPSPSGYNDLVGNLPKYKLTKLRFGNHDHETTFTQNYGSKDSRHLPEDDILVNDILIGTTDNHPYVKISKNISFDATYDINSVSELELILVPVEDASLQPKLFSRIKFDVIPITAGIEFSLEYYIYF